MKKLLKLGITLAVAAMMVVVGVFAAVNALKLNVSSKVYFDIIEDVRMDIKGHVNIGSSSAKHFEYVGKTYDAGQTACVDAEPWTIGDISFNLDRTITYVLEFTNVTVSEEVVITINIVRDANIRVTGEGGFDASTADTTSYTKTLAGDGAVTTFSYTLTINNLETALAPLSFGMEVQMAKVA